MIVRNIEEARKTDRLVTAENGNWDMSASHRRIHRK